MLSLEQKRRRRKVRRVLFCHKNAARALQPVVHLADSNAHYDSRALIPVGDITFALEFFCSMLAKDYPIHASAQFRAPTYAHYAAWRFVHSYSYEDKWNLVQMMLSWAFCYTPIPVSHQHHHAAAAGTSHTRFVIDHLGILLLPLGEIGEEFPNSHMFESFEEIVFSLVNIHAPHEVDETLFDFVFDRFAHVDSNLPKHYKLYALLLDASLETSVKRQILQSTRCTHIPLRRRRATTTNKKTPWSNNRDAVGTNHPFELGFQHADASRIAGMFQLFERHAITSETAAHDKKKTSERRLPIEPISPSFLRMNDTHPPFIPFFSFSAAAAAAAATTSIGSL